MSGSVLSKKELLRFYFNEVTLGFLSILIRCYAARL
jgi:hypothetical protein